MLNFVQLFNDRVKQSKLCFLLTHAINKKITDFSMF